MKKIIVLPLIVQLITILIINPNFPIDYAITFPKNDNERWNGVKFLLTNDIIKSQQKAYDISKKYLC
jgi:hypothetical protein